MKNQIFFFFLGGDQYIGGNCLKRQGWTICRFKEGEGAWHKIGGFFSPILEDRVHAITLPNQLTPKQIKFFQTIPLPA